ncbi:MAG TPA: hypothetical protein VKF32_10835 [Thermoanaerobaculia bacterium]|nr:hypothetical protein [Thermoanaerobaculia bacterium]
MKGRRAKLLVSFALALFVSLATAGHDEHWGFSAPGVGSQQHHHGPFGACPEVKQHHCLACTASLFAPAPSVARVAPPQVRRASSRRFISHESRASLPLRAGRSPPSSAV